MPENYVTVPAERGDIHISEDVIAVIAAGAIHESEGVAAMSAPLDGGAIRKGPARGVRVKLEDGVVHVEAAILARYGESIAAIGERAQKSAASALESMTGLKSVVDVYVAGVTFDK